MHEATTDRLSCARRLHLPFMTHTSKPEVVSRLGSAATRAGRERLLPPLNRLHLALPASCRWRSFKL